MFRLVYSMICVCVTSVFLTPLSAASSQLSATSSSSMFDTTAGCFSLRAYWLTFNQPHTVHGTAVGLLIDPRKRRARDFLRLDQVQMSKFASLPRPRVSLLA